MDYELFADRAYLQREAKMLFPRMAIVVSYPEEEVIEITVDGHVYRFEIGSDDDCYRFGSGACSFTIPLMPDQT